MIIKRDTARVLGAAAGDATSKANAAQAAAASDATSKANAAQAAAQAYADSIKPILGSWESKSNNTVYQAATDGTVHVYGYEVNYSTPMVIKSDAATPPTTIRARAELGSLSTVGVTITSKIKKGDYWKTENANWVFWIPTLNT